MDGHEVVGPARGAPSDGSQPDRRRVLTAGAAGIVTMALPAASAAATNVDPEVQGLSAPTGVSAQPIGYESAGSTGALRISWTEVTDATSYEVGWSTTSSGEYTYVTADSANSHDLTGLPGTDAVHYVVVRAKQAGTTSLDSTEVSGRPVIATGGTVSQYSSAGVAYVAHRYTGGADFVLHRSIPVEHLIVAGGGGGGSRHGGGGGAGGVIVGGPTSRDPRTYGVTVGLGGKGRDATPEANPGANGGDSAVFDLTALGGGRGGSSGAFSDNLATAGGSGGGSQSGTGAAGTSGQGTRGGNGQTGPNWSGGGGGGAGAAGGNSSGLAATPDLAGGDGGAGIVSSISGAAVTYGGGGGGSTEYVEGNTGGLGGAGGGGAGGQVDRPAAAGADGLGGGGGGGGHTGDVNADGGRGGDGVVILRYELPEVTPPAAPQGLTLTPAGYDGGSATGALDVSWTAVVGAASYVVRYGAAGSAVSSWSMTTPSTASVRLGGLDPDLQYDVDVAAIVAGIASAQSASVRSGTVIATGGMVDTFVGNGATDGTLTNVDGATYVVHTFTTVGTSSFTLSRAIDIEYLIIAGGGGGGSRHGGGGGAGGMRSGTVEGVATNAEGYPVVVGAGGAGAAAVVSSSGPAGSSGSPSSALSISATGGGAGGGGIGLPGGSGGGASYDGTAGAGIDGQGSDGGRGVDSTWAGGGGGGRDGVGGAAGSNSAGSGGAGRASVVAGNAGTVYAGGGGGSVTISGWIGGSGGAGGGGDGATGNLAGDDGVDGTGGGGGGGGFSGGAAEDNKKGGDGGSGRVVLRYRLPS